MTRYLRWYLLLVFVASGCASAPIGYNKVLTLKTVTVLGPNTTQYGYGSGFAVSDRVIITARHCVDEFSHIEINGYKLDIKKVETFGEDGAILTVGKLPSWVKYYAISDTRIRGAAIVCSGYDPASGMVRVEEGILTAPIATTALVCQGMSGGPACVNGVAVALTSALLPSLGLSVLEPLDVPKIQKAVAEATYE